MNAFIYVRTSESYDAFNACKLGKTASIPDRDSQYATGEIKRGVFTAVYNVAQEHLDLIERLLQKEFQQYQIYHDAGTEFYDKIILSLIKPYFIKIHIVYRKLSKDEIESLTRSNGKFLFHDLLSDQEVLFALDMIKKSRYSPRTYQEKIIKKSCEFFQTHDKGILVLMCGIGKTLISLWITQNLNLQTVLIGVSTLLLLSQWKCVIDYIFPQKPCLLISSTASVSEIEKFLSTNKNNCIVISTYASAVKIYTATKNCIFTFGMKINDEAHHLTTINKKKASEKAYIRMLEIPCSKQISLTATLKYLDGYNDNVIANNSIEYFGEIITRKGLAWSIKQKVICDYVIQTIITNAKELEKNTRELFIIKENDKHLFLAAFAALKSISDGDSHHLLIYANNLENSKKIIRHVKQLLQTEYFKLPNLFYENYNGSIASIQQKIIINDFSASSFGIISCVYCLGEGWDFPLLDGVVFAENMSSDIRIVQSALRASRKSESEPCKIAKIILPVFLDDESDLAKIKQVIYQIGLEDESIIQKIKVSEICLDPHKKITICKKNEIDSFDKHNELIHNLLLKTVKRSDFSISYEKARKILADKKITNKSDYYKLCKTDIRLPEDPKEFYKKSFKNWIHYLGIQTKYYDFNTCKLKIKEYINLDNNLIISYSHNLSGFMLSLGELDEMFPPEEFWNDYYGTKTINEMVSINKTRKKAGVLVQ